MVLQNVKRNKMNNRWVSTRASLTNGLPWIKWSLPARPSSSSSQKNYASAAFLAAIALVLLANVYQIAVLDIRPSTQSASSALMESFAVSKVTTTTTSTTQHRVAGLSCAKYGGPDDETAAEMIYWRDIPSDASWISPLAAPPSLGVQYLTFEPDEGGWNNIRMALETKRN